MARFDLNLLSALDALLNERNVTRAAERLSVTQPTMSGMLLRLRHQFDDQLLIRNGRGMELTHYAQSLIEPVRNALHGIEAIVKAEPTFDPNTSTRVFTLMASDYCTSIFLPQLVARVSATAPGVRLDIQALNAPVERMLSGEIDLCISTDNTRLLCREVDEDKLQTEHLFSDGFVCVVAENHPLGEGATLEEYLSYPHVGVQMAGVLTTIEAASLRRQVPNYKPAITVSEFSLVACMVSQSNLVGIVQQRLARVAGRTLPIRSFTPPFVTPGINETMLWHPRHMEDPAHIWLRGILLSEASAWLAKHREQDTPAKPIGVDHSGRQASAGLRAVH